MSEKSEKFQHEPMDINEDNDNDYIEEYKDNRKSGEWKDIDVQCQQTMTHMTASYSKISFEENEPVPCSSKPPIRPHTLSYNPADKPLDLDGTVVHDGDMTHFVADDLEYRIKISSPVAKRTDDRDFNQRSSQSDTPSQKQPTSTPQPRQVDITVINDLENESRRIAQSIDNLIENLSNILHANSSLTAVNIDVYKDAVIKTCDAMDSNIKSMYTILAKGEEVSQAMIPVRAHAARISEIRRLLNIFESVL